MHNVEITCRCGKRYSTVAQKWAGQFQCEVCGHTNVVPSFDQASIDAKPIENSVEAPEASEGSLLRSLVALIQGPDIPEYQPWGKESSRARRVGMVGLIGALGVLMCLYDAFWNYQRTAPNWSRWCVMPTVFAVGYFLFCGALLEWKWFFQLKKLRRLRYWSGDRFARVQYVVIGVSLMTLSVNMSYRSVSRVMHHRQSQAAEQLRQALPRIWKVRVPGVAAQRPALLNEPLILGPGTFHDAKFSSAQAAQVSVLMGDPRGESVLHRYDLRTGQIATKSALDQDAALHDFHPDAGLIVTSISKRDPPAFETTFRVWRCGPNGDEQITAIKLRSQDISNNGAVVGRDGVLLLTGNRISMHALPSGEHVYQHQHAFPKIWICRNRQFVLTARNDELVLMNFDDGTIQGEFEQPPDFNCSSVLAASFHPDGESVAVAAGHRCYIWSLSDGSLLKQFPLARYSHSQTLRWTSPIHLLAGNSLIDSEMGVKVWAYDGELLPDSPYGSIFYTISKEQNSPVLAAAVHAPSDAVTEQLDQIIDSGGWPDGEHEDFLGFGRSTLSIKGESIRVLRQHP